MNNNINKIYENIYKSTMPSTNTLINLSEQNKDNFTKYLSDEIKKLEKKAVFDKNLAQNEAQNKTLNEKLLKEQTDAFEAFMIKSVLDISVKLQNPLFGKDAADNIYSSMYNDIMSKALSGDLGFSELLFEFLRERV